MNTYKLNYIIISQVTIDEEKSLISSLMLPGGQLAYVDL